MTFIEVFETARNWLAENWTDLGVALLTICNASSFVVKKIFNWRSKKNDVQKTSSQSQEGQEDISQDFAECEVNQCNAESDERRNQAVKITGLKDYVYTPTSMVKDVSDAIDEISQPTESAQPIEWSSFPSGGIIADPSIVDHSEIFSKIHTVLYDVKKSDTSKVEIIKYILEVFAS